MASKRRQSFIEQLRRNAVALISLAIAITSLGYNTWRNERSEANRTQRAVSMEVLMKLGELQRIVWHHHFDQDFEGRGNLRDGWTIAIVIRDISTVLDDPVPATAQALFDTWNSVSDDLATSDEAERAIYASIGAVRRDTLALLGRLD